MMGFGSDLWNHYHSSGKLWFRQQSQENASLSLSFSLYLAHTHERKHTHAHTCTHTHVCTHMHMHTNACTPLHAHTHTHIETHTHTNTHTHMHTSTLFWLHLLSLLLSFSSAPYLFLVLPITCNLFIFLSLFHVNALFLSLLASLHSLFYLL